MIPIPIAKTFEICPQGDIKFVITKMECDDKLGKFTFVFMDADGHSIYSYHQVLDENGQVMDNRMNIVTAMARAALNVGEDAEGEIDPSILPGHYILAEVYHDEYQAKDGKMKKSAKIRNYRPCDGFDKEPCKRTKDAIDKIESVESAPAPVVETTPTPAPAFTLF